MGARRWASLLRLLAGLPTAWAVMVLLAAPVVALDGLTEITSAGPLTRIVVTDELNCQVAHRDDDLFELFPGSSEVGACGTFLAVDATLYGPSSVPSGVFPTIPWTPVSQSAVTGSGTGADPFRLLTVVDATPTGLRVEQADSYAPGSEAYTTEIRITNTGSAPRSATLYRAADCYLQESDVGFGRVDGGAPACVTELGEGARIEQWLPITPGSSYMEGTYSEVWAVIGAQQPFPNTCACAEELDNGAGLSWPVALAPGESALIAHQTYFSPLGRAGLSESFRQSVPSPTEISLDPLVIAQTVAMAAGVILLVPFPSALFNSTLEENYDEVTRGARRVSDRFSAIGAAGIGWTRRRLAARRARGRATLETNRTPAMGANASAEPPVEGAPLAWPLGDAVRPAGVAATSAAAASDDRRASDLWRTLPGIALFVAISALLYAFLDPTFGINLDSMATLCGLALGLVVVVLAQGLPMLAFARRGRLPLLVRALPATLVIGVLCVLISRLANFQPGYLYGLIVGFLIVGDAAPAEEGRAKAVATGMVLVTGVVAWLGLAAMRASGAPPDLVGAALQTAATTVVVAGFEAAAFAMLPLRFLPGAAVFAWDRRVWALLLGLGVAGFVHVLLNPTTGYLDDDTRASFLTLVVLLAGFGLASIVFWGYFRFRPSRVAAE